MTDRDADMLPPRSRPKSIAPTPAQAGKWAGIAAAIVLIVGAVAKGTVEIVNAINAGQRGIQETVDRIEGRMELQDKSLAKTREDVAKLTGAVEALTSNRKGNERVIETQDEQLRQYAKTGY